MRYPVSGRDMQAPMRSSPGSAREEDKFAGHCCDASVAGLGPNLGFPACMCFPIEPED